MISTNVTVDSRFEGIYTLSTTLDQAQKELFRGGTITQDEYDLLNDARNAYDRVVTNLLLPKAQEEYEAFKASLEGV